MLWLGDLAELPIAYSQLEIVTVADGCSRASCAAMPGILASTLARLSHPFTPNGGHDLQNQCSRSSCHADALPFTSCFAACEALALTLLSLCATGVVSTSVILDPSAAAASSGPSSALEWVSSDGARFDLKVYAIAQRSAWACLSLALQPPNMVLT